MYIYFSAGGFIYIYPFFVIKKKNVFKFLNSYSKGGVDCYRLTVGLLVTVCHFVK